MSDTDATQVRQDVVADVDEILEHVINKNMLSMPYDVYFELFDAVAVLGVKVEKLQAENAKLRELVRHMNTCIEHYEPDGSIGCEHCQLDNDTGNCDYERRMRELGVEVE